jgi:tRNA threonylcarbamoyladenosine biosynthesis protein TsaE
MHRHASTARDTEDLGRQLASTRPHDSAFAVLYLRGELGTGKTTFARGFLRALGVEDPVPSPTYTLLELYPAGTVTAVHLDLFRLRAASELESLGLREWAGTGHLWLIEWPERGGTRLPVADLTLAFTINPTGHDIEVRAHSQLGEAWLTRLVGRAA